MSFFLAVYQRFYPLFKQFSKFQIFAKFLQQLFSRTNINSYFRTEYLIQISITHLNPLCHAIIAIHYRECRFSNAVVTHFTHSQAWLCEDQFIYFILDRSHNLIISMPSERCMGYREYQ